MPKLAIKLWIVQLSLMLLVHAPPAAAYVGPGLGVSAIAAIFGVLAAFLMLLVGSVWYPLKRLFARLKSKD